MTKKTEKMLKGFGTVAAIGTTIAVVSSISNSKKSNRKKLKKSAMKAAQTFENVLNGISSMM